MLCQVWAAGTGGMAGDYSCVLVPFAYAYSIAIIQGARKPHHCVAEAGSAMGAMGVMGRVDVCKLGALVR